MSKRDAMVEAYIELLDEKPARRITVNDIASRCGVGRNTFYYYFADIPALIDALESDCAAKLRLDSDPHSAAECVAPVLRFASEHKRALLGLYRSSSCSRFLLSLDRLWSLAASHCAEHAAARHGLDAGQCAFLSRCLKCAFVGATLDWLESGMEYDLAAGIQRAESLIAGQMMTGGAGQG